MLRTFVSRTAFKANRVPHHSLITAVRSKSTTVENFHRPDTVAGSNIPADAADAAATILADALDPQRTLFRDDTKSPNKVTWSLALKERQKQLKEGKILDSFAYRTPKTYVVGEKTAAESFCYLSLPFKDDIWLRDSYINAAGRLRVGQLFQDLDALAGRIAYRHCAPAEPVNVTASVDRIYMVKKVDEIEKYNFVLAGSVVWTGRSSMEISVKGYAYEKDAPSEITSESLDPKECFLTANFTFVARNPETHRSFPINKLLPTTEKEWIDYRRAESHNASKKLRAKLETLEKNPPTIEESVLIHKLWSNSKILNELGGEKPRNLQFMNETKMYSSLFMQPQYRNRHSYMIFGGYLLRQTFELAYCAAAAFSHAPPRFVSLDSTTFKAPVPVGSVLFMEASICYTEHIHDPKEGASIDVPKCDFDLPATNSLSSDPHDFLSSPGTLIQVQVDTHIKQLDEDKKTPSGTFIYSYFVPRTLPGTERDPGYSSVIPQTYGEMMSYVEGQRRAKDTADYVQQIKRV